MSTKIQINSLEALERLIGGDTELEIEIRNSVVQNFADKHLKSVANTKNFKDLETAIQNYIKDTFLKEEGGTWSSKKLVFKDDILQQFKASLVNQAQTVLNEKVKEALETVGAKKRIEDTVNNAVERIVNEIESKISSDHIERLVQKRLKEKLGLS